MDVDSLRELTPALDLCEASLEDALKLLPKYPEGMRTQLIVHPELALMAGRLAERAVGDKIDVVLCPILKDWDHWAVIRRECMIWSKGA